MTTCLLVSENLQPDDDLAIIGECLIVLVIVADPSAWCEDRGQHRFSRKFTSDFGKVGSDILSKLIHDVAIGTGCRLSKELLALGHIAGHLRQFIDRGKWLRILLGGLRKYLCRGFSDVLVLASRQERPGDKVGIADQAFFGEPVAGVFSDRSGCERVRRPQLVSSHRAAFRWKPIQTENGSLGHCPVAPASRLSGPTNLLGASCLEPEDGRNPIPRAIRQLRLRPNGPFLRVFWQASPRSPWAEIV